MKAALAAIRGEKILAELAEQFDVHASQLASGARRSWKEQPKSSEAAAQLKAPPPIDVKELHAKAFARA